VPADGKKSVKSKAKDRDPDLSGIYYFRKPNLVTGLEGVKISSVFAGSNYCYAQDQENN
jgi:hypothetical protein